ncbi:Zinc finger protein 345 [Chionoecetes opilio]|uniref:Zinc finger protein 345 n=1 Tax=Chionoecetes opilio TaxID=41210 RepID=A0A8J4YBJ4_CHIOP|nr:Zinc finger protein 345 [Chionoecetes opilio]
MMDTKAGFSPHNTSDSNTTIIFQHDTPQAGTSSCISPSTHLDARYHHGHDSDAMNISQELDQKCGQQFTKQSNLKKHIERLSQQLEEPLFKCKYCNHVFKTKEARKRHHPVHKVCPANTFTRVTCSVCGFHFSSKEKLQHHLHRFTENPDERIFKCFFCSHAFATDFSRNRHEGQMHTEPHKLPCCCCGKLFSNRYKLKLHRVKKQIQRPPRCLDCGWVFAAQEYLEDHKRQVQRVLPLECLICHHRYRSHLALLRHLKFHTRKMEYECPSCLGRFSSQNLLTKHLRTAPQRANIEPY